LAVGNNVEPTNDDNEVVHLPLRVAAP